MVNTIPELIKYLLTEQNFKYVLTGKFQTYNLEARFGQYRQMSGANYHVTVQEILQAEKKLRIKSVLTLHSDKYGTTSLKKSYRHASRYGSMLFSTRLLSVWSGRCVIHVLYESMVFQE
ncbi:hypothetical protein TNCV_2163431 [Trichonephila clavipes]|nr:hypothetical protein TNCV_2163431 [Trichonephila clavipes]